MWGAIYGGENQFGWLRRWKQPPSQARKLPAQLLRKLENLT
jgi:hypothetical protein